MFLEVNRPRPKPPRNPAWIAAAILVALTLGALGWFKFRGGDSAPVELVTEEIVESDSVPPATPLEPVDIPPETNTATYSLSPVTAPTDAIMTPVNETAAAGPPQLDLPTLRASTSGREPIEPPIAPPIPPPSAAAASDTVMSAPRVPGMLTSRMSGEGAADGPSIETDMTPPASSARAAPAPPPTESATSSTPASASPTTPAAIARPGVSRRVENLAEAQIALDRFGISAGSIDGAYGGQTKLALLAFQQRERLAMTGLLNAETMSRLQLEGDPYTAYIVKEADLKELAPLPETWTGKARQTRLGYASLLELVAEKNHASPKFIGRLNPQVNWTSVPAGASIKVPSAVRPDPREKAAFIRIRLSERTVQAFDQNARIIAHYPCSIAASFANRPQGELSVSVLVENPNYTFDPKRFPDTPEGRTLVTKLIVPAGPNNPVGSAWIGLDKPGYGIHGTPDPEKIGRTGSLGCFRLANWNARHLAKLAWIGMPVYVVR